MKLEPFLAVDGTSFSITPSDLLRLRGTPGRQARNGVGLEEFDYGDVVYRFQDTGRLEEVTSHARVVTVGNVLVPFASLAEFLRTQDPGVFERAGFVVSPGFGLAFDPAEPFWVTALAAHCIEEWRAL